MPGDINTYALSLEFTLQSNAASVLGEVEKSIGGIEAKLNNLQTKFVKTLKDLGGGMQNIDVSLKQTATGLGEVKSVAAAAASAIDSSGTALTEDIMTLRGSFEGFKNDMLDVSKSMADIEQTMNLDIITDEYAKQLELQKQGLPIQDKLIYNMGLLRDTEQKLTNLRETSSQQLLKDPATAEKMLNFQMQLADLQRDITFRKANLEQKTEKSLLQLRQKGFNVDKNVRVSRLQMLRMSQDERKVVQDLLKTKRDQIILDQSMTVEQKKHALEGVRGEQMRARSMDQFAGKMSLITNVIGSFGNKLKGMFSAFGTGELARLTSMMGIFEAGVKNAMKREEEFHTANYRLAGSMEELRESANKMVANYNLTRAEADKVVQSMVAVGATKEEISALGGEIGQFSRVTGAAMEDTARFSKTINTMLGSGKAEKHMGALITYQREFQLSSSEMNAVMGKISSESLRMGQMGDEGAAQWTKALVSAGIAAKRTGKDISEFTAVTDKMAQSDSFIVLLGSSALGMRAQEKFQAVMKKMPDVMSEYDQAMAAAGDDTNARFQVFARFGAQLGVQAGDTEREMERMRAMMKANTEQAASSAEELLGNSAGQDALEKSKKLIQDASKEAESGLRKQQQVEEKLIANLEKLTTGVRTTIVAIAEWLDSHPWVTTFAVGATAVAGMAGSVWGLYKAFSAVKGAVSILSGIGSAASGAGGILGGLGGTVTKLMPTFSAMGSGAASSLGSMATAAGPVLAKLGAVGLAAGAIYFAYTEINGVLEDNKKAWAEAYDEIQKTQDAQAEALKRELAGGRARIRAEQEFTERANLLSDLRAKVEQINKEKAKWWDDEDKIAQLNSERVAIAEKLDEVTQRMIKKEQEMYEQEAEYKAIQAKKAEAAAKEAQIKKDAQVRNEQLQLEMVAFEKRVQEDLLESQRAAAQEEQDLNLARITAKSDTIDQMADMEAEVADATSQIDRYTGTDLAPTSPGAVAGGQTPPPVPVFKEGAQAEIEVKPVIIPTTKPAEIVRPEAAETQEAISDQKAVSDGELKELRTQNRSLERILEHLTGGLKIKSLPELEKRDNEEMFGIEGMARKANQWMT